MSKKTKHVNVTWHATRGRWYGRFFRDGKMHHVGYWPKDQLEKAIKLTAKAVRKYDREAKAAEIDRKLENTGGIC